MKIKQVIEHFGGVSETAKALSITYQAVQQWVDKGDVPEGRRWQIQAMSNGALKAEEEVAA